MYHVAFHRLAEAGFHGYELSNWARPGHESRHNRLYWERRPVEAVGPGAHAFDGSVRRWNAARLDGYLRALRPATDPAARPGVDGSPERTPSGRASRPVARSRRSTRRRPRSRPSSWASGRTTASRSRPSSTPRSRRRLPGPMRPDLVEQTEVGRVRLTIRGRMLSNEIFARLI